MYSTIKPFASSPKFCELAMYTTDDITVSCDGPRAISRHSMSAVDMYGQDWLL